MVNGVVSDTLLRLLPLGVPVGLGLLCGRLGLFARPGDAVGVLNRYVLYVAFPALLFGAVAGMRGGLPTLGFYGAHAALVGLVVVGAWRLRWVPPTDRGVLVLGGLFGNVVYLGLPVASAVLGDAHAGLCAISASITMTLSLLVGPALLLAWGGRGLQGAAVLRRVARQPLVWAPALGAAARFAPTRAVDTVRTLLDGPARSAAPVALFLLGVYLYHHRALLARPDRTTGAIVALKLLGLPALAAVVTRGLGLPAAETRVIVLLSAMPTAITTFAIAHDLGVGDAAMARAIVLTTCLCVATVPVILAVLPT